MILSVTRFSFFQERGLVSTRRERQWSRDTALAQALLLSRCVTFAEARLYQNHDGGASEFALQTAVIRARLLIRCSGTAR
jgi:hypothetical protein